MEHIYSNISPAIPRVWTIKNPHPSRCSYLDCPDPVVYGVGYQRPVRRYCSQHLLVIVWDTMLMEELL